MSQESDRRAQQGGPPCIGEAARHDLLAAAREALRRHLGGEGSLRPDPAAPRAPSPPHNGVFVTLRWQGQLRGCIGSLDAALPLPDAVESCAVSAASDPRFAPLALEELAQTHVEISVLGPGRRILSESEILIGRDGVMVSRGSRRALLLPQVAPQHGWDAVRLLEETCLKAGLPPDDWRSPETKVEIFPAEVFGDPER